LNVAVGWLAVVVFELIATAVAVVVRTADECMWVFLIACVSDLVLLEGAKALDQCVNRHLGRMCD